MAYAIVNEFPGGTKQNYEAAVAVVHPSPDTLPEGQTYHYAGPTADGWTVIAIWDSKERWESFRDDTLLPGLQGLGADGFPGPPQVTEFEVDVFRQG